MIPLLPISSLSSLTLTWMPDSTYWISQKLVPKAVTWNSMSPSCLKITTSPTRRSCALANSFQPSVSLWPSIFTFHVLSEQSDLSLTVLPSCFPSICLEKNVTGIFCNRKKKHSHKTIYNTFIETDEERQETARFRTRWLWKPVRRGWKKCGFAGVKSDAFSIENYLFLEIHSESLMKLELI